MDDALSEESTNLVENRIVTSAIMEFSKNAVANLTINKEYFIANDESHSYVEKRETMPDFSLMYL